MTQVELPSLLGCSISLACDPHTSRGGGNLPTPSISTCPLSSILPSILYPPTLSSCLVYCQRCWMKLCQTNQIKKTLCFYQCKWTKQLWTIKSQLSENSHKIILFKLEAISDLEFSDPCEQLVTLKAWFWLSVISESGLSAGHVCVVLPPSC